MASEFGDSFLTDAMASISTVPDYWGGVWDRFVSTTKQSFAQAPKTFLDSLTSTGNFGASLLFTGASVMETGQKVTAARNGSPAPDTVASSVIDWAGQKMSDARITKEAIAYSALETGKAVGSTAVAVGRTAADVVNAVADLAKPSDDKTALPLWLKLTFATSALVAVVVLVRKV